MTVLLETGDALVGDLAVNGAMLRLGPNMSAFAENPKVIRESWGFLLDNGAKVI
jgi:hypothetical protein